MLSTPAHRQKQPAADATDCFCLTAILHRETGPTRARYAIVSIGLTVEGLS